MDARFVIAYHGTSSDRAAEITASGFSAVRRKGSWLGTGQYFFYRAHGHASVWARNVCQRPRPKALGAHPVVITCKIDLESFINLLDNEHWDAMRAIAAKLTPSQTQVGPIGMLIGQPMTYLNVEDHELVDAYVARMARFGPVTGVMAAFIEGQPVSTNSWLFDQSHVCLSVIEPAVIDIQKVEKV